MRIQSEVIRHLRVGRLKLEVHPDKKAAGEAAARDIAQKLRELANLRKRVAIIFATGASQLETLAALTSTPNLPWSKVQGFHLDEYLGIDKNHPASFRRYLNENLTQRVYLKEFYEIDGNARYPDFMCKAYEQALRLAEPQICLLGIGENGHLAFNDPAEANFDDPADVKIVQLDELCRVQQTAEGWFDSVHEVPQRAITLTIPALFRVPKLIVSVPGKRKARIVRRTLEDEISTSCPATLLRTHPDVTVYLDIESAADLEDSKFSSWEVSSLQS
jgi:glucosamine-6-phosphate deaminase